MINLNLTTIDWETARGLLSQYNPELSKIIDKLSPTKQHELYIGEYNFGDKLLCQGEFFLPKQENGLISLKNQDINRKVKEDLSYNGFSNPVMLPLTGRFEIFTPLNNRIIPYLLLSPGNIFGVWKLLANSMPNHVNHFPYHLWDISAGARSLFMLPKISENIGHEKLCKKFNLSIDKPLSYYDHWSVFSALANSAQFEQKWRSTVLFFPKKWFEKFNDPAWQAFKLYMIDYCWQGTEYWRNQFIWRMLFTYLHNLLKINPSQYYVDIVNHLIAISVGALPGFEPALTDECGPIKALEQTYKNIYGLKWSPIIMQPAAFDLFDSEAKPVYYSLQYPSTIELSPKDSKRSSAVTDIYHICSLLKKYLRALSREQIKLDDILLTPMRNQVDFNFYHTNPQDYSKLSLSTNILHQDKRFVEIAKQIGSADIPINSTFFKGCASISHKEN